MGIKLLSNYPIKQFPGISIPNVELSFKGAFRQEKRDNQYTISSVCYLFPNSSHDNAFDIIPIDIVCQDCPENPLTVLYDNVKSRYLSDFQYEDN